MNSNIEIIKVEGGILPDEKHLAKLHKRVNFALQAHRSHFHCVPG